MGLLRMSLLKLARRPATWLGMAVMAGLIVLFYLALAASVGQFDELGDRVQIRLLLSFPNAYTTVVGMILGFGGLLAVAYGAAVIGADWAWGTIRSIIARGESRVRYSLVTFLAIAIVLGIGIVAVFAIGAVIAVMAAEMSGIGSEGATDPDTLAGLPELLGRTWLGVAQQAAIGFAVAMLTRSQLAGVTAGLALYFAEMFLILVPLAREVLPYFPFNVAGAVVATSDDFGGGGFVDFMPLDSDTALMWSVGYLVLALTIATLAAWRAQITQ
jgi:ABC-2 type transport system permease protein